MARKISILFLVIAGLLLIFKGVGKFQLHQDAQTVAVEYVKAVMTNDASYLYVLTHPDLRKNLSANLDHPSFSERQEPDGHRILVHHVLETGPEYSVANLKSSMAAETEEAVKLVNHHKTAKVRLVIEKDGYQLKPDIYLEQEEDGTWYVTFIEGLEVDPRWTDRQQQEGGNESDVPADQELLFQQTVEELRTRFENREGVSVSPGL